MPTRFVQRFYEVVPLESVHKGGVDSETDKNEWTVRVWFSRSRRIVKDARLEYSNRFANRSMNTLEVNVDSIEKTVPASFSAELKL